MNASGTISARSTNQARLVARDLRRRALRLRRKGRCTLLVGASACIFCLAASYFVPERIARQEFSLGSIAKEDRQLVENERQIRELTYEAAATDKTAIAIIGLSRSTVLPFIESWEMRLNQVRAAANSPNEQNYHNVMADLRRDIDQLVEQSRVFSSENKVPFSQPVVTEIHELSDTGILKASVADSVIRDIRMILDVVGRLQRGLQSYSVDEHSKARTMREHVAEIEAEQINHHVNSVDANQKSQHATWYFATINAIRVSFLLITVFVARAGLRLFEHFEQNAQGLERETDVLFLAGGIEDNAIMERLSMLGWLLGRHEREFPPTANQSLENADLERSCEKQVMGSLTGESAE